MIKTKIDVAVGVLYNEKGQLIISKRKKDKPHPGLWEFPGGKREANEEIQDTLSRELHEELGIEIKKYRPLINIKSIDGECELNLYVFLIHEWTGKLCGREGQIVSAVFYSELLSLQMPESNRHIIKSIMLPDRFLITPAHINNHELFISNLRKAFDSGISLFQLRVFGLDRKYHIELIDEVHKLSRDKNVTMLLNGSFELLETTAITSIHLNSSQLHSLKSRPENMKLVSASCHNAADLKRAMKIGIDFAVLSPVFPTKSHPDANPLGWKNFENLVDQVSFPVFALGGMKEDHLSTAWRYGAQGIAGIRGLWPGEIN
tara:strand:+ start:25788 stop:26741 length:954 start_codon:yes stop_codon:yes gene_type:complete